MDVVFWNSTPAKFPFTRYIGPYKIAHWIRKSGYDCQVIDFIQNLSTSELYNATEKFITPKTKILGISTTFLCSHNYVWPDGSIHRFPKHLVDTLRLIKQQYPNIKVILGGYISDKIYMDGLIDATIMSYVSASEDIFLEYLEHLIKGTPLPFGTLLTSFIGSGNQQCKTRMFFNSARNPKYNIETDDFKFIKRDVILSGEPLPLDISRGCIFACRFCQYPHLGKKKLDYIRGMEFIQEEILYNHETFNTKNYYILDDTFNDTEWKIKEFYNITEKLPFDINYVAYLRADLLHRFPDTAHQLKKSGLFGAYHGIESLHPYASNLVGKSWSGKKARDYIPKLYHDIWKGEVPQHLNFIVGLPKETKDDIISTVDWFKSNKLYNINFNNLILFEKGNEKTSYSIDSEFGKNAEKYGFEFVDGIGGKLKNKSWINETWTEPEAMKFSEEINISCIDFKKVQVFNLLPLLFLGFTKEYLTSTKNSKYNWKKISHMENLKTKEYYEKLMNV